jgi:hypothetical protein
VRRFTWRFGTDANPKTTRSRDPDLAPVAKRIFRGRKGNRGCFSVFVPSRSDPVRVAVAFKPRSQGNRVHVAERRLKSTPTKRFKRRSATPPCGTLSRGLKPTATVLASLREAQATSQKLSCARNQALQMNSLEKTVPAIRIKGTDAYA